MKICLGLGDGLLVPALLTIDVAAAPEVSVPQVFPCDGVFIGRDNQDSTVVERIRRVDAVVWEGEESLLITVVRTWDQIGSDVVKAGLNQIGKVEILHGHSDLSRINREVVAESERDLSGRVTWTSERNFG
jgi:hypothetical protein